MLCPHCKKEVAGNLAECPSCGLVFAKWAEKEKRLTEPRESCIPVELQVRQLLFRFRKSQYFYAAIIATIVAAYHGFKFVKYLPITEGWAGIESVLFPLSMADLAFHEAGHIIFSILGVRFITVAGGTLAQLAFPVVALCVFLRGKQFWGVLFCLFWIGLNLGNISLYAADAKIQALILITGKSGAEGGGHDWNYMLGQLGLINHCIGIGRLIFMAGVWLMAFAPLSAASVLIGSLCAAKSSSSVGRE